MVRTGPLSKSPGFESSSTRQLCEVERAFPSPAKWDHNISTSPVMVKERVTTV